MCTDIISRVALSRHSECQVLCSMDGGRCECFPICENPICENLLHAFTAYIVSMMYIWASSGWLYIVNSKASWKDLLCLVLNVDTDQIWQQRLTSKVEAVIETMRPQFRQSKCCIVFGIVAASDHNHFNAYVDNVMAPKTGPFLSAISVLNRVPMRKIWNVISYTRSVFCLVASMICSSPSSYLSEVWALLGEVLKPVHVFVSFIHLQYLHWGETLWGVDQSKKIRSIQKLKYSNT